jgi:hypothetical protein
LSWFAFRDAGGMMPTLDSQVGADAHKTEARLNVSTASRMTVLASDRMVR